MKSETPRTDAEIDPDLAWNEAVFADFARQLERELNEWRTVADELASIARYHGSERRCSALIHFDELKSKTVAAMPNSD